MTGTANPIRILSFGAGVQSSYVARMSIIGDIPPFDHVIFADIRTGNGLKGAGLIGEPYLHRARIPLSEVDFDNEEDKGQLNLFEQECEGMCGL